jgi:hypothetical protein
MFIYQNFVQSYLSLSFSILITSTSPVHCVVHSKQCSGFVCVGVCVGVGVGVCVCVCVCVGGGGGGVSVCHRPGTQYLHVT